VLFDGTHRLKARGRRDQADARIGTFAEQVVCPAEQLVPIKKEMPWPQAALARLLRADGRRRRHALRRGGARRGP